MTDEKNQGSFGKDILGLVLGAIALFLGVSIVMALAKGVPTEPGQIHRMTEAFVGFLGVWPGLAICVALVAFGVILFVKGPRDTSLRDLLGMLGTGFALAVLFGAVATGAGGTVGRLGGIVTDGLGWPIGLIFGAIILFAAVWLAWLRGLDLFSRKSEPARNPTDEIVREPYEGVSDEEAQALLPQLRRAQVEAQTQEPVELPPLYPEDVRLKGEIPPGARPLESSHDRTPSPPPASAVAGTPPQEVAPAVEPGGDLAATEPASPGSEEPGSADASAPLTAEPYSSPPDPVPTWEQRSFDDVESPVDSPAEPSFELPAAPEAPESAEDGAEPAFDAEEEYEYDDEEADEVVDSAALDEDDDDEAEELDDEESPTTVVLPEDEADEAWNEEPDEEAESTEELAADEEWEDEAEEEAEPTEVLAEDESADEEWEDEAEEEAEPTEVLAEDESADEEWEDEAEEEAEPTEVLAEDETAETEPDSGSEREVTIEPRSKGRSGAFPPDDLVRRAGDLILDRQRVAVSLLQRTFELDFKQATLLLDALQEQGLIGPYLGGQKRDILLTVDEWRARV